MTFRITVAPRIARRIAPRIASFSRTFAFISRHPWDRYYPSLFPRQSRPCYLENAVSEKPSSLSNFHFLIPTSIWFFSLCISLSNIFRGGLPKIFRKSINELECRENGTLKHWGKLSAILLTISSRNNRTGIFRPIRHQSFQYIFLFLF